MIVLRHKQYSLEEKDFTLKRQIKYLVGKGRVKIANKLSDLASKNEQRRIESINTFKRLKATSGSREEYKNIAKKLYKEASDNLDSVVVDSHTIPLGAGSCTFPKNSSFLAKALNNKRGRKLRNSRKETVIVLDKHEGASKHPAILGHEMGHKKVKQVFGRFAPSYLADKCTSPAKENSLLRNLISDRLTMLEEKKASKESLKYLKKAGISKEGEEESKKLLDNAYDSYKYSHRGKMLNILSDKITIPGRTRNSLIKKEEDRKLYLAKKKVAEKAKEAQAGGKPFGLKEELDLLAEELSKNKNKN